MADPKNPRDYIGSGHAENLEKLVKLAMEYSFFGDNEEFMKVLDYDEPLAVCYAGPMCHKTFPQTYNDNVQIIVDFDEKISKYSFHRPCYDRLISDVMTTGRSNK
tara:strand:+ start:6572 stop:6886 length:315 start_codon:yes stop_codon:yes gene_type:complete